MKKEQRRKQQLKARFVIDWLVPGYMKYIFAFVKHLNMNVKRSDYPLKSHQGLILINNSLHNEMN
ncbi:hypothetical protein D3C81_1742120 [compost metagenome]